MNIMKIIFKSIFIFSLVFFTACSENTTTYDLVTDGTNNGVALKTIENTADLSITNPAARTMFKVSVIDPLLGDDTKEVKVYARIQTASAIIFDEVLVATIPNAAFERGGQYPTVTFSASKADIEGYFNTTITATQARRVRLRLEAITNDGRLYTNTNANGVVRTGSFFKSPFEYSYPFRP